MAISLKKRPGAVFVGITLAVLAMFAAAEWHAYRVRMISIQSAATVFYAEALREAHVQTRIVIGGVYYTEADGVLSRDKGGAVLAGAEAYEGLRLAYAQTLAERHPLLDLTGVEPDSLAASVEKIKSMQTDLLESQSDAPDAALYSRLYPIHFLDSLAPLETARQHFIDSASSANERAYEQTLGNAVAAGLRDSIDFNDAFTFVYDKYDDSPDHSAATSNNVFMPQLGGAISAVALHTAAEHEVTRMRELSSAVYERTLCLNGEIARCTATDLLIPNVLPAKAAQASPRQLQTVQEIVPAVAQIFYPTSTTTRIVILASSTCLSALPPPYYFLANLSASSTTPSTYVGDIYFQPLDARALKQSFSAYFFKTYGTTYLFFNPMQFYICPETGSDLARIRALSEIALFAGNHPSVVPGLRAPLVSDAPLSESDAVSYLREALAQEQRAPDANFNRLISLALMYNDLSAGLDSVVSNIAFVNSNHVADAKRGIPFDVSLYQMYLTHSAAESLYLAYNPSTGSTPVSPRIARADVLSFFYQGYSPYSVLSQTVSPDVLFSALRAMVTFEGH